MRKSRVALLLAVMLLVAAGGLALAAYVKYRQPLPLPVSPFEFDVRAGTPLATVARTLRDAGVIPHPAALTLLGDFFGDDLASEEPSLFPSTLIHRASVAPPRAS